MRHWESFHWIIAGLWFAYPATIAFYAIVRRQLDRIAPAEFGQRKES